MATRAQSVCCICVCTCNVYVYVHAMCMWTEGRRKICVCEQKEGGKYVYVNRRKEENMCMWTEGRRKICGKNDDNDDNGVESTSVEIVLQAVKQKEYFEQLSNEWLCCRMWRGDKLEVERVVVSATSGGKWNEYWWG